MATEKLLISKLPPIERGQAQHFSPRVLKKYEGLSGPTYTIGKADVKYNLPPPHILKPYNDTKAGGLETWPAHATGQTATCMTVALTKDKQLRLVDEDTQIGPQSAIPKPKFLEQLETFLKQELKALGVTELGPSELRLQAHREVFEYLIEDFKTYRPLLSAIKNEYEMMLSYQSEMIRQLEPLKQMLVTVSEQCDQKIMFLREEEKQEMVDLKKENQRLYNRIDELRREQVSLEAQVERLQEELAAEYLRYRDECDARKLLVSDMNELKAQQEDLLAAKQNEEEEEEEDDPLTLKIALRKARDDEASASRRLNEMIANYGDVVPRRDHESLSKQHADLETRALVLQQDFHKLRDEHDTLLDVHNQLVEQRDEFRTRSEELQRSGTPRPEWEKCGEFISGGMERWKELWGAKSSDELVDVLLAELSGAAAEATGGAAYFEPQGNGEDVPLYLRYSQRVRNRKFGKRDTALLIQDIWKEKQTHNAEHPDDSVQSLAEFVHAYLERRFPLETMVYEWAYNLHDACLRYVHEDRIGLFLSVLKGEAKEEVHYEPRRVAVKLLGHLIQADATVSGSGEEDGEDAGGSRGFLPKEAFRAALQEFFPDKSEEEVGKVCAAAEAELEAQDHDALQYRSLFMEDDEGRTGAFMEEIRTQYNVEKHRYVAEIRAELGDLNPISVEDLKKAIIMADPEIDAEQIEAHLMWAFNASSPVQLDAAEPLDVKPLLRRLKGGNLKRATKKS